jgi:hypothetical protein
MPAMRAAVKQVLLLMISIGHASVAGAFSADAHRVVGRITETYLCAETRAWLLPLLDGSTLADAGVWADAIRDDTAWRHTRGWHFINVTDRGSLDAARDRGGNVLTAIREVERELSDARLSLQRRGQALRFLVHFVVDVHQPLHVGRVEDQGGNEIEVVWRDEPMSLHEFWDGRRLLRSQRLSHGDLAYAIGMLAAGQERQWQASSPLQWAEESRALRPMVYRLPAARDGARRLDDRYVAAARNVVSQRLAQAAVRLAGRLNRFGCPGLPVGGGVQAIEPAGATH